MSGRLGLDSESRQKQKSSRLCSVRVCPVRVCQTIQCVTFGRSSCAKPYCE